MKLKESPTHCAQIEDEVDGKPWYYDIRCYIKDQQYPQHASENDKRILRRLAANFLLDSEIPYKKGKDQILLRCVDALEARCIIAKVHEGICGTHVNGHKMSRQIMRVEYYWMTLEKDDIQFARKYHKCQVYAEKIHVPPNELHVMTIRWPFLM